jgi:hypothetical protein
MPSKSRLHSFFAPFGENNFRANAFIHHYKSHKLCILSQFSQQQCYVSLNHPGGIRTRDFCSRGRCDDNCAFFAPWFSPVCRDFFNCHVVGR